MNPTATASRMFKRRFGDTGELEGSALSTMLTVLDRVTESAFCCSTNVVATALASRAA